MQTQKIHGPIPQKRNEVILCTWEFERTILEEWKKIKDDIKRMQEEVSELEMERERQKKRASKQLRELSEILQK